MLVATSKGDKRIKIPKISATVLALIVSAIILTSATTALLTISVPINTSGTVVTPTPTPTPTQSTPVVPPPPTPTPATVNIKVYSNPALTDQYSSITWDAVMPGQNTTKTVYIKNEGNTAVTLHMEASNWSPTNAANYIAVTWNRENYSLQPNANVTATLTLSVSSLISGITSYDVDVVITGTAP